LKPTNFKIEYLSKSTILGYEQCPLSFYYSRVEKVKGLPNPYFERGIAIHEAIKNYYDRGVIYDGEHIEFFIPFLHFDKMAGRPKLYEETFVHEEFKLKGIIDAYFSDGTLVDFKTSAISENGLQDYRFELGVYKLLLEHYGHPVKRFGICFLKSGDMVWEPAKDLQAEILNRANLMRKGIEAGNYEPKENKFCFNCSYRNICPLAQKKKSL